MISLVQEWCIWADWSSLRVKSLSLPLFPSWDHPTCPWREMLLGQVEWKNYGTRRSHHHPLLPARLAQSWSITSNHVADMAPGKYLWSTYLLSLIPSPELIHLMGLWQTVVRMGQILFNSDRGLWNNGGHRVWKKMESWPWTCGSPKTLEAEEWRGQKLCPMKLSWVGSWWVEPKIGRSWTLGHGKLQMECQVKCDTFRFCFQSFFFVFWRDGN